LNLKKAAIVRKTIRGMVFSEAGAQAGTERHRLWVAKLKRCAKHNCVLLSAPKKKLSISDSFFFSYNKTEDLNLKKAASVRKPFGEWFLAKPGRRRVPKGIAFGSLS